MEEDYDQEFMKLLENDNSPNISSELMSHLKFIKSQSFGGESNVKKNELSDIKNIQPIFSSLLQSIDSLSIAYMVENQKIITHSKNYADSFVNLPFFFFLFIFFFFSLNRFLSFHFVMM